MRRLVRSPADDSRKRASMPSNILPLLCKRKTGVLDHDWAQRSPVNHPLVSLIFEISDDF